MGGHVEIWFPHGQNFICCGLTSFWRFLYKFLLENTCTSKNLSNDSLKITKKNRKIAWLTLTGIQFPNGPVFRYGNFFIPGVEKSSQISPRAKNLVLPRAVGPREARFFSQGLIFEDFSTRGMKKFSYLKTTAHSEIVFLYELTKRFCAPIWRVFKKIAH